ncbi:MAG TPA: endonuclease/exonuclease/phosphatase family protein [Candidatus Competibacteraceae bacterium]|nr:endonuclease/exonuclease/phosphatase family protein [Candidatus Competibacteraceae bacterium]HQA25690.1 endonuclease/exonuclease/phosphatase family protein [Candidatus Competibacteraceae bacterium]HQD57630.1 endonuclease/exonuclease/phosphatase family protein [Candidatus Competibacteraceae bacterium]
MRNSRQPSRLRLLSYNIQSGLSTRKYSQYLTRSWKHLVPVPSRMSNLDGIAQVLADYDVVGLQEIDVGSLRSGFINQAKYLADYAGFQHMFDQANRKIGMISQHGNALLSQVRPSAVTEHKLPGLIPGRGVLEVRFEAGGETLTVLILHLALGRRGRLRQIEFLAELVSDYRHVIMMGDLNCRSDSPEMAVLLDTARLCEPAPGLFTFPSWQPDRQLDHILVSPSIVVEQVEVLDCTFSDHLPIAMDVRLPFNLLSDE